jgi:hypothetical protein
MYATPKYPPSINTVIGNVIHGIGGLLESRISPAAKTRLRMWTEVLVQAR